MGYRVDAAGDVYARDRDGGVRSDEVDPDAWGWGSPAHRIPAEQRATLDELAALPGFTVEVVPIPRVVPGPRPDRSTWPHWTDGAAPPASYESAGGANGHFSRLSEALGYVAGSLPANPASSPYVVHDLVGGRRIEVGYTPPPVGPGGEGVVYVVDDGVAIKVGHTVGPPAVRIKGLQTGNPRLIVTLATIAAASPAVEAHLHRRLGA